MSAETQRNVYEALKLEPQTPNEIAKDLCISQKTVQSILLELSLTNQLVKWKKIGRFRIFWKICDDK